MPAQRGGAATIAAMQLTRQCRAHDGRRRPPYGACCWARRRAWRWRPAADASSRARQALPPARRARAGRLDHPRHRRRTRRRLPGATGRADGLERGQRRRAGDTSAQALERLPALLAEHRPALVIVSVGGNDFLRQAARSRHRGQPAPHRRAGARGRRAGAAGGGAAADTGRRGRRGPVGPSAVRQAGRRTGAAAARRRLGPRARRRDN